MFTFTHPAPTFAIGALVRLRLDQGPRSIGVVTNHSRARSGDGVQMVPVRWFEDRDAAHWLASNLATDAAYSYGDVPDDSDAVSLAVSTLVPICENVDVYADEYGMACSEPGVPTSFDVPCHYDAANTVVHEDEAGGHWFWNLCPDHAVTALLDVAV